jgi:hypothetical protein
LIQLFHVPALAKYGVADAQGGSALHIGKLGVTVFRRFGEATTQKKKGGQASFFCAA